MRPSSSVEGLSSAMQRVIDDMRASPFVPGAVTEKADLFTTTLIQEVQAISAFAAAQLTAAAGALADLQATADDQAAASPRRRLNGKQPDDRRRAASSPPHGATMEEDETETIPVPRRLSGKQHPANRFTPYGLGDYIPTEPTKLAFDVKDELEEGGRASA